MARINARNGDSKFLV